MSVQPNQSFPLASNYSHTVPEILPLDVQSCAINSTHSSRLYQNGTEITLIPKNFGEVVGEQVLRPMIDLVTTCWNRIPSFLPKGAVAAPLNSEDVICVGENCYDETTEQSETDSELFIKAYQACKENDWETLLQDNLDKVKNSRGRSLLHEAIFREDINTAHTLIKKSIALSQLDFEGNNALHYAAMLERFELIHELCENGLDVDSQNSLKQTPLHLAAKLSKHHSVQWLFSKGGKSNLLANLEIGTTTFYNLSPMQIAVISGDQKTLEAFFVHYNAFNKSDARLRHEQLGTALHLCVHFRRYDLLQYLLEKQFEYAKPLLEATDKDGLTPFILAAKLGEGPMLFYLKEKGANIEAEDFKGNRAMHHAALQKNIATIRCLYNLGADLKPSNHDEKIPRNLLDNDPSEKAARVRGVINNLEKHKTVATNTPPSFMAHPPENLVFQGGGPKGIAYVGVIEALEEKDLLRSLKRVAGTSAGSINAGLLAVGYKAEEIKQILYQTDLKALLLDHPLTGENLEKITNPGATGAINILYRIGKAFSNPIGFIKEVGFETLWKTTGVCKGEKFRKWVDELIEAQTGIKHCTFGELKQKVERGEKGKNQAPFRHLYVYANRLKEKNPITCINSEDDEWKDIIISDAIRASMSIPGVFEPHKLHSKNKNGERRSRAGDLGSFVDGGVIYNFPIEAFDKLKYQSSTPLNNEMLDEYRFNKRTLGFSLYTPDDAPTPPQSIDDPWDVLSGIGDLYMSSEEHIRHLNPFNRHRVIPISNEGVGMLDFSLIDERKNDLINSGIKGVNDFFEKKSQNPFSSPMHGFFQCAETDDQEVAATPSPQMTPTHQKNSEKSSTAHDKASHKLIQDKLDHPNKQLTTDESIHLISECIQQGEAQSQKALNEEVIIFIGNTGAGKSTTVNYLSGCTLELKPYKELGVSGIGKAVVVKPAEQGGKKNEIMPIGHGTTSKTFMPQVERDEDTQNTYVDCPGFLDNRGFEINIANAVNIKNALTKAKTAKVVILINYHSLLADKARGLSEMLKITYNLFGSAKNLKKAKNSILIGVTNVPLDTTTLEEIREFIIKGKSNESIEVLQELRHAFFTYDPIERDLEGAWKREEFLQALKSLKPVPNHKKIFSTVLTDEDEIQLIRITEELNAQIKKALDNQNYEKAYKHYHDLKSLSVIEHPTVERLFQTQLRHIESHIHTQITNFYISSYSENFSKAKEQLARIDQALESFKELASIFDLSELKQQHQSSIKKYEEREKQFEKHREEIQNSQNKIEELIELLEAQKAEIEQHQINQENAYKKIISEIELKFGGQIQEMEITLKKLLEERNERLSQKEEELSIAKSLELKDAKLNEIIEEKQKTEAYYQQELQKVEEEKQKILSEKKALLEEQQKTHQESQSQLTNRR